MIHNHTQRSDKTMQEKLIKKKKDRVYEVFLQPQVSF